MFSILATQHNHPKYIEMTVDFIMPKLGNELHPEIDFLSLTYSNFNGYFLDTLKPFELILLEFDKISRHAVGKFSGYLYNYDDSSSYRLHITDGKFNVKF